MLFTKSTITDCLDPEESQRGRYLAYWLAYRNVSNLPTAIYPLLTPDREVQLSGVLSIWHSVCEILGQLLVNI
jgi:hypothetical protein